MAKKINTGHSTSGTASDGASFVLGVFSIFLAGWFGLISGAIGLILILRQRKRLKSKLSTAALVLNIIGVVLSIVIIILFAVFNFGGVISQSLQ